LPGFHGVLLAPSPIFQPRSVRGGMHAPNPAHPGKSAHRLVSLIAGASARRTSQGAAGTKETVL
jgi:hypothetical protein